MNPTATDGASAAPLLAGVTPTQKWTLEEGPLGHVSTMSANMHPITVEREDQEFELDLIF